MSTNYLPLLQQKIQFKTSRWQSVLSNYDPSAYPADLQFARNHGLAQRIGQYIPQKQDVQRCPCCFQPIYKPELPLDCNPRQLLHIGSAYPLYLLFVKQCILLIMINIIICSIPSIIINVTQGKMCIVLDGLVYSFYGMICKSSVINIMDVQEISMLQVQAGLNFAAIFVSIFVIAVLDIKMNQQYRMYYTQYHMLPKASDYSVMIKGLPKDITVTEITQFINQKLRQAQLQPQNQQIKMKVAPSKTQIQKIYLIYNLRTYYSLYSNKRSLLQQIIVLQSTKNKLQSQLEQLDGNQPLAQRTRLNRQKKQASQRMGELENKKQMVEIQINKYQEMFKIVVDKVTQQQPLDYGLDKKIVEKSDDKNKVMSQKQRNDQINGLKLTFSGKCIVTFNNVQAKQVLAIQQRNFYFLQRLGFLVGQCLGGSSSSIVISDAPQPSQIIFSNIGSAKITRWRDNVLITLGLSSLIFLDFVLLTIQKKFVKQQKAYNSSNLVLSFINSQIIALFNSIVSRIIRSSQNNTQVHSTQSSYYYSVTSKLVILYLINMLVTTFFSNLVNYYLINQKTQTFDRFPLNFEQYLFDIFFLLITNPFTSFFLIFFDHRQGYKLYKRYQIQNKNLPVTQAQANLYYQNMQIDLSNKYSNAYRFVLFSAGVCFIYPPALIICFITLSIFYWLDKYLILRRYVIAHKLNFYLTAKLQKILWMFPMMMAITNLIIMFVPIRDGRVFQQGKYSKAYYYLAVIAAITTIIIYFGGCNWVSKAVQIIFFRKKQMKIQKMPEYKDIQMDFQEDYWHFYPYFKIKKQDVQSQKQENKSNNLKNTSSPRKQKIDQMHKKVNMDVFKVIKNHLHHDRYAPIV